MISRKRSVRVRNWTGRAEKRSASARRFARLRDAYGHGTCESSQCCWHTDWLKPDPRSLRFHFGGWDHHWDLKKLRRLPSGSGPYGGLRHSLKNLDDRGLLRLSTGMCYVMSSAARREMSKRRQRQSRRRVWTPRAATHWGNAMFSLDGRRHQGRQARSSVQRTSSAPPAHASCDAVGHPRDDLHRAKEWTPSCSYSTPAARPVNVLDDPGANQ